MFIEIEMDSDIPIYIQLMNGLIEAIANGTLQPNDALPSVRSLAADLGINMHTVNKSYHELVKKGIIQIIPKSGAVVSFAVNDDATFYRLSHLLRPVIAEMLALGIAEEEIKKMTDNLISTIKEGQ